MISIEWFSFLVPTSDDVVLEMSSVAISRKKNFVFMISDFDNTKLALRTPLSQGRICGKIKSGKTTVKAFLQLRRITVIHLAGRNTYEDALKFERGILN